ncbi:MAG TPA: diguanylate cyclase [Candidatus Baltobacteraceae bacterium]|jgi:diguanylate cyclase (GGDEF)-like protein/PAS domain S-box-containing protein
MGSCTPSDLLASLYEGNPDAIVLYDREGRLVAVNAATRAVTGFAVEEMLGAQYHRHIAHREEAIIDFAFEAAKRGESMHVETTIRCKDGRLVPVECHIFPAKRDGEIVGVFAQARDIVALRSAEASLGENQERFRSLFEYHPDGIMVLKPTGVISRINVALESVTGFFGEQVIGKTWTDLIAPENRAQADAAFAAAHRGEASEFDALLLDRLGDRIDIQLKLVPLHVGQRIEGAYAIAKNVAAQRDAERAIARQSERIRELYVVVASRNESIEAQIDNALALGCRLFDCDYAYLAGFEDDQLAIRNAFGRGNPVGSGDRYPIAQSLARHIATAREPLFVPDVEQAPWSGDQARERPAWRSFFGTALTVGGRRFGALVFAGRTPRIHALGDPDRDLLQLMALFVASALERAQHAERIEQLAFFDSLTGVPNRVLFNDRMRQTMAAAKRYGRGFAAMYLDLDKFKEINDTYGHPVGDLVLKAVAERLLSSLRESDTVARFGGDEFVILQPVVNGAADAADLARKIVTTMQKPVTLEGVDHVVHVSIGIALYPHDGTTSEDLMDNADRALYRAKNTGRNRWFFYNEQTPRADWPTGTR